MPKNHGKEAERAFVNYWTRRGAHVERLRDKADLVGLNGLSFKRLADFKKPSDFLVSGSGHPLHYAEVKSTSNPESFPFANIEDGQHKAAILEATRGNQSYFFYVWSVSKMRWYIMPCRKYADCIEANRRSVKFTELEEWHR